MEATLVFMLTTLIGGYFSIKYFNTKSRLKKKVKAYRQGNTSIDNVLTTIEKL